MKTENEYITYLLLCLNTYDKNKSSMYEWSLYNIHREILYKLTGYFFIGYEKMFGK